jgi:hypothetical protein
VGKCPTLQSLEGLLNDSLGESERTALVAHIEICSDCQQSLDKLSAPERPLGLFRPSDSQGAETINLTAEFLGRIGALPSSDATPPDGEGQQPPSLSLRPPQGYEIVDVLGRGGSGVVYKAIQVRLKRTVALKMLLAGSHASENDRTRFLAEAEAVARLQSPNIVQIFEVGEQEGCPFLALEYVEGHSLADHLKGTPQPSRISAHFCEILARAVQLAHDHGIVHRDLKPANILLAGVRGQASEIPEDSSGYWLLATDYWLLSQNHRFWPGQAGRFGRANSDGPDTRDTGLHGSRASSWPKQRRWAEGGYLRTGSYPLPPPHRKAPVSRRYSG